MIEAESLIACARDWLRVPFVHQGRSRFGCDCAGLIIGIAREQGILPRTYSDVRDYGRAPQRALQAHLEQWCERTAGARVGVIALIHWPNEKIASHCGLITGATIIHCYGRIGRVVEHGYRGHWVSNTQAYFALPGVRYE